MMILQVMLTFGQIIGFSMTFVIISISTITLVIKINQANQEKLNCKLDVAIFKEHERVQEKDYAVIDNQIDDIYKEVEFQKVRSQKIEIFMTRIDEKLLSIEKKLDKM